MGVSAPLSCPELPMTRLVTVALAHRASAMGLANLRCDPDHRTRRDIGITHLCRRIVERVSALGFFRPTQRESGGSGS
jgi:hypothetical protein